MSSKSRIRSTSEASHETKGQSIGRKAVAFFLFLTMVALSLCLCAQQCFLNSNKYAEIFSNEQYINGLYQDVLEYSCDMCDYNAIPKDSVEQTITYESVEGIATAYAYGNLTASQQFTETTYLDKIDELEKQLVKTTNKMLKDNGISESKSVENGAEGFADNISNYLSEKVNFVYMEKLKTVSNIGKTASVSGVIVFSIIALILVLTIISIGNKKFRSVRAIAYALIASGELQLLLVLGVELIKRYKTLVIYPSYLCDSVMNFVNNGILTVFVSAMLSIFASLILTVAVWKLKRNQK